MSEIDDLRATVAALTERLQLLEDQMALIQLTAQYGPNVDSGAAEDTAALWTDDGAFDVVGVITMHGHDEIAGMVDGEMHQGLIVNGCGHVLTTPHVEIDGDDAFGRSYALNIRWDPAAERFWVARVSANTWKWRRTSAGWRITERVNANLDGTPEHRAMLAPPTLTRVGERRARHGSSASTRTGSGRDASAAPSDGRAICGGTRAGT